MTAGRPPQSESDRREAAATWLVRLQANDASEAEWLAFETWLGDPANKIALAAVEAAMGEIDDHTGAIAAALRRPGISTQPRSREIGRRSTWAWAGAAAGLALAAAVAFAIMPKSIAPSTFVGAFSAPGDATRSVDLADGSTVTLNRGAAIEVRWTAAERRVVLTRGEAAFRVRHDPTRQFVVAAGDALIWDVGTEFNVLTRANGITVTVRTGSIEVAGPGLTPVPVAAGGQLRLDSASHRANLSNPNADDAFAWQDGRLVYREETLAMIVDDLNRYGGTPIRIVDPEAATLRFSGVLRIQPLPAMMSQLQAFLPVRSEQGKGEILLRRR